MTLSITGSPVLIGNDDIGHIEFLPTDMDAVDASGKPTGERLLIARTPHTNEARNRINAHLLARGETHGSMAMHQDGTAYVVRRGFQGDLQRARRTPVMEAGHDTGTVISVKHGIQFYPDSALIMADPNLAMHPAVHMTWYESASQAAALEDVAQESFPGMRIRMMRNNEYTRFVTWDDKYTQQQVKAKAHLYRDGVTGTASVTDAAAAPRTTEEGFVDPFGNVWIWTDGVNVRPATGADMDRVTRVLRGASWRFNPQNARVGNRGARNPYYHSDYDGVRWAAVPACGGKPESIPQKGFGPIEF